MTKILSARIPDALYDSLVVQARERAMTLTDIVIRRLSGDTSPVVVIPGASEVKAPRRRPRKNEIVVGPGLEDF